MTKRILITGADGFIGSHLVEECIKSGHAVKAIVHYNSMGHRGWLEDIDPAALQAVDVIHGDIRDSSFVQRHTKGVDEIFHLAALIAIPYSYQAAESYIQTNVLGTLNLLESAKRFSVSRFIHTSTSEVYGSAQYVPIDELHPLVGQSPYSASKIAADQIAYSYFASHDVPVVTVRPFNTYGPRQSSRAVIPTIITQAICNRGEISLGSLTTTRDFSFVSDTAQGIIAASTADLDLVMGRTFNLGSGFEISIGDVVEIVSSILGIDLTVIEDLERRRPDKSEVNRLFADNSLAMRTLPWLPTYTGLSGFEMGLRKTITWFDARRSAYEQTVTRYAI